jgi:hypothetical protein
LTIPAVTVAAIATHLAAPAAGVVVKAAAAAAHAELHNVATASVAGAASAGAVAGGKAGGNVAGVAVKEAAVRTAYAIEGAAVAGAIGFAAAEVGVISTVGGGICGLAKAAEVDPGGIWNSKDCEGVQRGIEEAVVRLKSVKHEFARLVIDRFTRLVDRIKAARGQRP